MRRRLLASTLTIVIATVLLFGLPLAIVLDRVVHDEAQDRLVHDANRLARELQSGELVTHPPSRPESELARLPPADNVGVIQYPDGKIVNAGEPSRHAMSSTVEGPQGTEVTRKSPASDVDARVQRGLIVVLLVSIGALTGALVLALWQSRRLSEPL